MLDIPTFFNDKTGYGEVFVFCKNNHLEYFFDDMWYREYVDLQGNKGGDWWHLEPIGTLGKAYRCVDRDMDFLRELKREVFQAARGHDYVEEEDWNLIFD